MINEVLAKAKGLSEDIIKKIEDLHKEREILIKQMEAAPDTEEVLIQLQYKRAISIEKQLQKLWGFEDNPDYIKFWIYPKCICPKLDNEEAYPTGHYTTNNKCILHKNKREY